MKARLSIDMQDLKDLKSRFFKRDFAAANEHRRFTVARGPVPRERFRPRIAGPSDAIRASERVPPAIVAWRGTGPCPTVKGGLRATRGRLRSGDRKLQSPVARGPVPRDRCLARDRPSPYGKRGHSGYRSAGSSILRKTSHPPG